MIYTIIVLFVLTNILMGQDWKYLSDRIGGVMSVSCPDSNNCFCLVQETLGFNDTGPLLFKSTDQGKTWDSIYKSYPEKWPNITLFNGRAGASPDKNHYFISWWDVPAISKSTDGGHTFSKIFLDTADLYNRNLYEFTMYDSNYGYARADGGLYFTNDGWETFENKVGFIYRPRAPLFLDSNIMVYVSSLGEQGSYGYRFIKFFVTNNKMDTLFNFGYEPITGHFIYIVRLYFLNDTVGFACGFARTGIGETRNGLLFRTKDGGYNWDIVLKDSTIPISKNFGFNDIAFYDDKRGVLVGYYGKIFFTKDGGDTWIRSISEDFDREEPPLNYVTWAGHYPLIGTSTIGIYRYEGNFFDFPPEPKDTTITLVYAIPEPGEDSVSVNTKIYAKFDDMLDTNKFTSDSYSLQNINNSEKINGKFYFDISDSTLRFIPDSSLPYMSNIQVNFNNIYDIANNVFTEYNYIFTTEPDTSIGVDDLIKTKYGNIKISVMQRQSRIYFAIEDEHFRKYKLQIFDIMGNVAMVQELSSGVGTLYVPVDISGLTSGAYLYMISCEGVVVKTGKIVLITNY